MTATDAWLTVPTHAGRVRPTRVRPGPRRSLVRGLLALVAVIGAAVVLTGCSHASPARACDGNLHPYQGKCMTDTMIAYAGCTSGQGFAVATRIGADVGGSFRKLVSLSVGLAHETAKKEDTPVALQIVHDCLTLSERTADTAGDRAAAGTGAAQAAGFEKTVVQHTPHISLSRSSAPVGGVVGVRGVHFWAHETVDIDLQGALVKHVVVDGRGAFHTTITVPGGVLLPGVPSTIEVDGESSAGHAEATLRLPS